MMSRTRAVGALLAALLVLPVGAASATGPDDVRQAARTTKLVIKVKGCKGVCTVEPQQWPDDTKPVWSPGAKRVRHGKVSFKVPTARTKAMVFSIRSSRRTFPEYQPYVALRYAGKKVGSRVTPRRAARAKKVTGCWAGTTKRRQVLRFRVSYFPLRSSYDGKMKTDMRAWSIRTLRTVEPMQETWRGTIGSQESSLYC